MNKNEIASVDFLPHVSLIQPQIVYAIYRRHPIYFWNKTHVRAVACELTINPCTKCFEVEYFDKRTYGVFKSKEDAENFLGRKIPELEDVGKQFMEKVRGVSTYYICKKCGHIGHAKMEMVFLGPFDAVLGPISKTITRTCPNCKKGSVDMDISTEPCQKSTVTQFEDCDLAQ